MQKSGATKRRMQKLITTIFAASRLIHERTRKKGSDLFSMLKLKTLDYIAEQHNPLMKDVAAHLCITPPSATSLVDGLVKSKLLARHLDTTDRRLIRLLLTPQGRTALDRGHTELARRMEQPLKALNAKEQEALITIIKKITRHYKNEK